MMSITVSHIATPDLQKAVHTALRANTDFTNLSPGIGPFDPPRRGITFPYVTYGEHNERNWYHLGNTGRQVLFMFHVWSQQMGTPEFGFGEAYQILDIITQTLETQTLIMDNFTMGKNGFLFQTAIKMLDSDGITRHVVATYRAYMTAK
jgi:hypothetical protein